MRPSRPVSWESHLVMRACSGEEVAFELITDTYRPVLMSLAKRILRNSEDANDAVQETFLKAFRAIPEFDPERPLRPWLCKICSNCCVDLVRRRRSDGDSLEQHEYMLSNAEEVDLSASVAIQEGQLFEAIGRLPEKYRTIVLMRHFKHMEVTEIATKLHKPEGTIKSWLFRARALLRKELTPAMG